MTWREIGNTVHLTGQAVAERVKQMEYNNIITGYTIRQGNVKQHFVTIFMDTTDFSRLEDMLNRNDKIEQAFKVTGDGCYHVIHTGNDKELDKFLTSLLAFGRYRVLTAIKCVK